MSLGATSDLWWRNAVVYCLDVETFADSDGDGCGDFNGLTDRVDHLADLGVTCIWLMPFYPTPDRDDGYDITDFYGVDPRLGTLGDVLEFVRTAHDRGIRVIADLVVNHTSDQHPWFQAARSDPSSKYREYYVWADEKPEEKPGDLVFPDVEDSNWEYDEAAGAHYLHRFYRHQPDLNVQSQAVRDEIAKIAGFWLQVGMSGFRIDAVPFLLETIDADDPTGEEDHELLRDLRAFLARRRGDAILLGEVNLAPEEQRRYFGEHGEELHLLFNFILNQAMYLALARGDAAPIADAMETLPEIPDDDQWAVFVRNHDELTLDKLSEAEREEVFAAFGPDEDLQLFGRGLRRRLPPMLAGDADRIRMVYSLLLTLPGTPVLFYGEEIGMGENLAIEGRLSVRSPMQWSSDANGGFSTAAAEDLRAAVTEGAFGPERVNAADQRRDEGSLYAWMRRAIRRRREHHELGWGTTEFLDVGENGVCAFRRDWDGRTIVALHNLGEAPCRVTVRLADQGRGLGRAERVVDLLGEDDDRPVDAGRVEVELGRYGHAWLAVCREGDRSW